MKANKNNREREVHKDLIEECKKGNPKAQLQLYELYSRAMLNTSYRIMHNRELAEDMLQEAFSQAFMSLHTFRYESSFGSWLKSILINNCINELKKRKVELIYTNDLQQVYPVHDEDEEYEKSLNVKDVKKAMESLPAGSRTIFSLYLLEGYDHQEIAQILNISESASRSQYSRAKTKIRKTLTARKDELKSEWAFHHRKTPFAPGISQLTTNNVALQHI